MKVSSRGIALIASFEGFPSQQPYNDPTGFCTVGYGHLLHRSPCTDADVRRWSGITKAQAKQLLQEDVAEYAACVERLIRVPLNQSQFDALTSFVFNLGCGALEEDNSTLARLLNSGDYAGAQRQFGRWVKGGGETLPGLVRRRAAEAALFGSRSDPVDPLAVLTRAERRAVQAHRKAVKNGWRGRAAYWRGVLTAHMRRLRALHVLKLREKAPRDRYARYIILRQERGR